MLDAYFSRLEHILVLLAAFSPLELADGELCSHIGANWGCKFRALFCLNTDLCAKRVYDSLKTIKEDLRNPASHGGFLKNGESLLFHSEAGAIPVLLTRVKTGFEFHVTPVPPATFDEVCDVLDDTDAFFKQSALADGFAYVVAGLDVAFDPRSREQYRKEMDSGDFDAFIERQAYIQDMHSNMDY